MRRPQTLDRGVKRPKHSMYAATTRFTTQRSVFAQEVKHPHSNLVLACDAQTRRPLPWEEPVFSKPVAQAAPIGNRCGPMQLPGQPEWQLVKVTCAWASQPSRALSPVPSVTITWSLPRQPADIASMRCLCLIAAMLLTCAGCAQQSPWPRVGRSAAMEHWFPVSHADAPKGETTRSRPPCPYFDAPPCDGGYGFCEECGVYHFVR
jgi:hypothetical protein